MADLKRGDETIREWRAASPADDDPTVVAPRFDEGEAASARPVVPLGRPGDTATGVGTIAGMRAAAGGFSLRTVTQHLLLAWAVVATLTAGGVAVYRNAHPPEPEVAPQPATEKLNGGAATAAPRPAQREVRVAPARAAKIPDQQHSLLSWERPDWSDRRDVERDKPEDEELDEDARKEEKRRRKEEKKRREEFEKDTERALKQARKQAERLRERVKDEGRARLIGVITKRSGM